MTFQEQIEATLDRLMPQHSLHYRVLFDGGRYSLFSGGKRIRPLLTLTATEIFSPESLESALQPACALELIHTYSLIHDDLPCMDDDDLRRGRPALHKVYSEGHAVLVGDYLLTYAFELLASAPGLSADQKVALTLSLARGSGADGMIGGQIMDIEGSSEIEFTHRLKTAALFRTALEFGGIIAGVSQPFWGKLQTFGTQFGLLFQMVDDILDNDHPHGHEAALEKVGDLYKDSCELLSTISADTSALRALADRIWNQLLTPSVPPPTY